MNCTKLSANIAAAVCDKQALAGTGRRVILLNFDDVDKSASTIAANVIEALAMKAAAKGISFTSLEDATVADFNLKVGTWFNSWQHNLNLNLFTKDEAAKTFLRTGAGSKVIAIVENKEYIKTVGATFGTGKYEVYGWDSGLEIMEATGTTAIADGVVYAVKFGTKDSAIETTLPMTLFKTDLTATDAIITSLITA